MSDTPLRLEVVLAERSYGIHIGTGLLRGPLLQQATAGRRALVLTDTEVAPRYLPAVLASLGLQPADALVLPSGEASKTWDNAGAVLDWLLSRKLARDGVLVALGGGVMGDLAGFCAAIYQRGIAFVQVPTTLLAMVDSSVGGKTGVNSPRGKNLIGAIHQPDAVVADLDTLKTLPQRELRAGAAEIIKYGMLGDADFFARLETGELAAVLAHDADVTARVVAHCCGQKARIVALDERETLAGGPRSLLNLGHTFGHAVEAHTGYSSWLHGEAVGLGLAMAADLSARLGWTHADTVLRVQALLQHAGLPLRPPAGMTPDDFRSRMAGDKKTLGGRLRLVLLRHLGEAVLTADFDPAQLDATLAHYCAAPA